MAYYVLIMSVCVCAYVSPWALRACRRQQNPEKGDGCLETGVIGSSGPSAIAVSALNCWDISPDP